MAELINVLEAPRNAPALVRPVPTVTEVHQRHGEFVWKTLYRMGLRRPHLEDVYQEVFVVVHRRLGAYNGNSAVTTWLFEVCFRVTAGYRRRAHFQREQLVADPESASCTVAPLPSPERQLQKQQAARRLERILDKLSLEQRVVFTLFELDGLTCEEIAASTGSPVGTVYSRLSRARKAFERALSRERLR